MRAWRALLVAVGCVALAGCDSERTWSAKATSPDGQMVATAATVSPGGWGTASPPTTAVDLNWTHGSQRPTLIFQLRAEKEGSDGPGLLNVGIRWAAPDRLVLTYSDIETIVFQAVRCDGVEIEVVGVGGGAPAGRSGAPGR